MIVMQKISWKLLYDINPIMRCVWNPVKEAKMKRFRKILNGWNLLTIFFFLQKTSILDNSLDSESDSATLYKWIRLVRLDLMGEIHEIPLYLDLEFSFADWIWWFTCTCSYSQSVHSCILTRLKSCSDACF